MKFETYIPCDILKPYVKHFAVQETTEESTYKILPGINVVIGFQYKGQLSRIQNGSERNLSVSGISGLTDKYLLFKNSPDIGTVLIYFKEAGAAKFFRHPLHELFRESVSLDNFMLRSELLCLEEQLAEGGSDIQRISAVESFLIGRMTNTEPDKRILVALSLIHRSKGCIRIKSLLEQVNLSQSALEKRFRLAVGASPKKYASIVRIRNIIRQATQVNTMTELGYEAGFYDQAHFIKEFKTFTGETPEKFFSKKQKNDFLQSQ